MRKRKRKRKRKGDHEQILRSLCVLANRHTIVLMQPSQNRATRTFMDFDSISQSMDEMLEKDIQSEMPK
ncbi:hypothetical protein IEQ34_009233 [Dendrobium chrysotoxum]|uniref:Uncharacterized protein n=1 Tax=Dendrobium chrysotoxum TaxID=161865 RepID=A0AAV7H1A2_DENCH|nr:hypothetical protein IEQ34_009233 [Dendrobium chrysotoxum]